MDALIRYVCIAPGHAPAVRPAAGDLAVHAGSWAFCPSDERGGHLWQTVGPVGVDGLVPFGLRGVSAQG